MPQVFAAGLEYIYEGCDPALTVCADRDKMQQIVLNMLSNAIKFTSSWRTGSAVVRCGRQPDAHSSLRHGGRHPSRQVGSDLRPLCANWSGD